MRRARPGFGLAFGVAVALAAGTAAAQEPKPPKTVPYPTDVRVLADIPYLGDARPEKADLYLPKAAPADRPIPAVILIHGGGFTGGDKANRREVESGRTLALHGYAAFSINYELWSADLGRPTWPRNLHDAKTAVRWLREHGEEHGIDPDRIGVIGFSAGATLAALLALTTPADGLDPPGDAPASVRCAIDFYGPADLENYHDIKMFQKTHAEDPEVYRRAAPISYAKAGRPGTPLMIVHGTKDATVPLSQSEALAAALRAAGAPHELVVVEGAPHSFDFRPKQRDLRPVVLDFLDRHLRAK